MGIDPLSAGIMAAGSIGAAAIGKPKKMSGPAPRNYLQEMQDALSAQSSIQGRLLDLERLYTPRYQELQRFTLGGQLGTLSDLYSQAGAISSGLQSDYIGMQAPLYGQIGRASMNAYQQTLDPATRGLYSSMMQSAQGDIAAGRNLTPEMERMGQQAARAAMAARGLQGGNQAIMQEVLNNYNIANAREDRARQFAANMYRTGAEQASTAYNMYGQPLLSTSAALGPTGLLGTAGQMASGLGTTIFQPESEYNAALQSANQGVQTSIANANAQMRAGWSSGLMGIVGQLGGAMLRNPKLVGGTPVNPYSQIENAYKF
jgi:hypothetical protein